ncbi:Os04g0470650, partial [Oryza sativa Japonica Group]
TGRGERGRAGAGAGAVVHGGRGEVGGALLGEEVEHLVLEAPQRGLGEVRHLRRRQRGGDLGHEVREGLVRDGVDAHPGQLLLQLRVPVVLHVVVRPPRKLRRDHRPP